MMKALLVTALLLLASAKKDSVIEAMEKGYDPDNSFEIWQLVVIFLGVLYVILFLAYTVFRLCWEEAARLIQYRRDYKSAINQAASLGINVHEVFHPKKVDEDEEYVEEEKK